MWHSPEAREALVKLMTGVVPERTEETEARWQHYNPEVWVVPDRRGVTLNATKDRIACDAKLMNVFWLICFSGWKAIECYIPHVIGSIAFGGTVAEWMQQDHGLYEVESAYKARRAIAQNLIDATDLSSVSWPPDIPRVTANREASVDPQYKAAFDLTLMALAFAFFHEFQHVMLDRDGKRPADLREEELLCDVLARDFITAKLEAYAKAHGHDYHQVLRKRAMALGLMALVLHEITPSWDHGGSEQYFSVAARMQAILENTPLSPDDPFWCFTAALLVGIFRQRHSPIDAPSMTAKALTGYLIGKLE